MNSNTIEKFSKLSDLLLSASLDPKYWQNFLDGIHQYSGGIKTHIFGHDCGENEFLGVTSAGYSEHALKSYEEHYHAINPWAETFLKHSTGKVLHSEEMCSKRRMENTEFYNDWVRPQEDIVGGGGSVLFNDRGRVFLFGGNIRRKDIEAKEQDWMDLVALLTPQIQKALNINRRLAYLDFENQFLEAQQIKSPAIFVVNSLQKIIHVNRNGEQMLGKGDIVKSDTQDRLQIIEPEMKSVFQSSIASLKLRRLGGLRENECTSSDGAHNFNMKIVEIPDPVRLNRLSGLTPITATKGLILFLTPVTKDASVARSLKSDFSLTERESQVALGFSSGKDIHMLAQENSVSEHTIRNQLKSSMSKMGVHRQAELVGLVLKRR